MSEHKRKAAFPHERPDGRRPDGGGRPLPLRWRSSVRYGLLAAVVLLIALMFPHSSRLDFEYEIGSIWSGDTVRAPFAFPIYKDENTYKAHVTQAESEVLPIFIPSGMDVIRMHDTLLAVAAALAVSETPPRFLSPRAWAFVQAIPPEKRLARLQGIAATLHDVIAGPFRSGVINREKSTLMREKIIVRRGRIYEDVIPLNSLFDSLGVVHTMESALPRRLNPEEIAFAIEIFSLVYTPTYVYSESLTSEARATARSGVTRSLGIVTENEIIVRNGDEITSLTRQKLSSFRRSWNVREEEENVWWQIVGNIGHVGILLGLGVLYLYNFRRRIYYDNLQLGIILSAVLLMALLSYMTMVIRTSWPLEFLILMPLLSMLLAILFDSRTAFYLTVSSCFIVAGVRGNDYTVAIACLSAGVLAAYTVRDIRSRTQLLRSIGISMFGYSIAIIALGLERQAMPLDIGVSLLFAAINSTVSPVLTFALILLVENRFGVATDLKLLEYDSLDHPLLRALADKAPGTYQHTLTMSRLAESAAAAIGANALLAKVGALYHDIGKVAKAEYFVENQMQMSNKHDKIKPDMSARIIRNHVADGIALAREYGLPQRIIDFIPMHHGTTVIKYFYDKAKEVNPDIIENEFRYPGPLPHSRETAIVMLADGVEATIRSLPNATPKTIEETIDRAIKKRFSDGQLDQCELTLADLTKIRTAFIKNLAGINHPRIQYRPDEADKMDTPPPQPEASRRERSEPVIPYIDDAFGNVDAEAPYTASTRRKRQSGKDERGKSAE